MVPPSSFPIHIVIEVLSSFELLMLSLMLLISKIVAFSGQHHLVRQSPHLGAASLCCSLKAQINADQEGTHPFTRQSHLQSFLFAEGAHDLERHTGTLTKHLMRQDCQLLSHSPSDLLEPSTTPATAIQFPSVHGVCVHIAEDLRAPPLKVHEHVFLRPAVHTKSVDQAQEPLNVMPATRVRCFL